MSDSPIDRVIAKLEGVMPSGDTGKQWVAFCPAHDDSRPSLAVGIGRAEQVVLHCYAGCEFKKVVAELGLKERDLYPDKKVKVEQQGVSTGMLEFYKRIPAVFLRDVCGLKDNASKGIRKVLIPYKDESGKEMFTRERTSLTAKAGSKQPTGEQLQLYGRWRLPEFREAGGTLFIVEGESDTWTLWFHNYPAVGIPGANAVKGLLESDLAGFDLIYIWRDGKTGPDDKSGDTFVSSVAKKVAEFRPTATVRMIFSTELKDPNAVHQKHDKLFPEVFKGIIANAQEPNPPDPEAEQPVPSFALTDMGNAQRLREKHGKDLKYEHSQGTWYIWNGLLWDPDMTGEIVRRAKDTVVSIFAEAATREAAADREAVSRWAIASQSAKSIAAMYRLTQSEQGIPVRPTQLDADPWLLNCPNVVVDLRTGETRAPRREDLITKLCPIEYNPAAKCPTWDSFLRRVFAIKPEDVDDPGDTDLIGFVQRLFGYCLTGVVRQHIFPIFWGAGSNGKTTLLNVIKDVMGPCYWTKAPRGFLMVRKVEQHPTEMMLLRGSRLMVATETGQDGRLNEELIKDLTGGEDILGRLMRENFGSSFAATCKLLICTNHRPRIAEGGAGTWRRLRLVPFLTHFWDPDDKDQSGPDHLRQDGLLPEKMKVEYPGILAWIVRGCLDWQRQGLKMPKAVRDQTASYREDEDWVAAFLVECCRVSNAAGNTFLKTLYAKYAGWAEGNGYHPVSSRKLKSSLITRNIVVKPGSGNQVTCFGLEILTPAPATSGSTVSPKLEDFDD